MTEMTKVQRTAVLDFHNGMTSKRYWGIAQRAATVTALVRNGWAVYPGHVSVHVVRAGKVRTFHVTTAGLAAAGVDMDAIHEEAKREYREATRAARMADSAAYQRELAGSTTQAQQDRAYAFPQHLIEKAHADAKIDHVIWTARHTPIRVVEMFEVPRCFWLAECPDEAETVLCTDEDLADWFRRNGPEDSTVWTWLGPKKVEVELTTQLVSVEPDSKTKAYETTVSYVVRPALKPGGLWAPGGGPIRTELTRISWDV